MDTHSTGSMPFSTKILVVSQREAEEVVNKFNELLGSSDATVDVSDETVDVTINIPVGDADETDKAVKNLHNFVKSLSPNRY